MQSQVSLQYNVVEFENVCSSVSATGYIGVFLSAPSSKKMEVQWVILKIFEFIVLMIFFLFKGGC